MSNFGTFYNSAEVEMAVHEQLRMQESDFYSDGTHAKIGQMH
jgi:hypothetical protein